MWPLMLVLALPVIEIALFIWIGGMIGIWAVLGLVLLAALVGIALIRIRGGQTLAQVQQALRRGEDPGQPIFGTALILMAAVLFITPGFFTDLLAGLLLLPPVRGWLYGLARQRLRLRAAAFTATTGQGGPMHGGFGQAGGDRIIDGEFEEVSADSAVDPHAPHPTHNPPSGWTRH